MPIIDFSLPCYYTLSPAMATIVLLQQAAKTLLFRLFTDYKVGEYRFKV